MKSLTEYKMLSLRKVRFPQLKTNYLKSESTSRISSTFLKKVPAACQKQVFEQLFLRIEAPSKFLLQASTKKTCLFCVGRSVKAESQVCPARLWLAQLGSKQSPIFTFSLAVSSLTQTLNFEKSPKTKPSHSITVSQVEDFPVACL